MRGPSPISSRFRAWLFGDFDLVRRGHSRLSRCWWHMEKHAACLLRSAQTAVLCRLSGGGRWGIGGDVYRLAALHDVKDVDWSEVMATKRHTRLWTPLLLALSH